MSTQRECEDCGNTFPSSLDRCIHCARPGLFPNVYAAENDAERSALDKRYREAVQDADSRGCISVLKDFEKAVESSKAVIARSLEEVQRLASSDKQLWGPITIRTVEKVIVRGVKKRSTRTVLKGLLAKFDVVMEAK